MRAIVLLMALFSFPAIGQTVGPWTLFRDGDSCSLQMTEHQGKLPTDLAIFQYLDRPSVIIMNNIGWSIKDGDKHQLYVAIDDELFETSSLSTADHLITFRADAQILKWIASSKFMTVFLKIDDTKEVPLEQFDLAQSSAALVRANRCLAELKATRDAERRRENLVPSDPFAIKARQ